MRFSKFTRGSSVCHTNMRKKLEEVNPYIYTITIVPFFAMKCPFLIYDRAVYRIATGTAGSYITGTVSLKNRCQIFFLSSCRDQSLLNLSSLRTFEFRTPLGTSLLLHSSRKHWKCKYYWVWQHSSSRLDWLKYWIWALCPCPGMFYILSICTQRRSTLTIQL